MIRPVKFHLLVIGIGCLLFNGFCQSDTSSGRNRKTSVAIFPCKADSGVIFTEVYFITERITLEALRLNQFTVIDKYEIAKRAGNRDLAAYDTISDISTCFDLGKKSGADQIVWGSLARKGAMLLLDLRLGNVALRQLYATASTSIVGSTLDLAEKVPQLLGTLFNLTVTPTKPYSAAGVPQIEYKPIPQPRPIKLTVRSVPEGARVYVNGAEAGTTPYAKDSVKAGSYTCRIEKYGYLPFSEQITVRPNDEKKMLIYLEKAFGSLTVQSTPTGAAVTVSNGVTGHTPFTCDTLRAGTDTLRLMLDGYAPFKRTFTVVRNKSDTVTAQLVSLKYLDSMKKETRRKHQIFRRIGFGALSAGFFGVGLYYNHKAHEALERETSAFNAYKQLDGSSAPAEFDAAYLKVQTSRQEAISNCKKRNVLYSIAGVFCAGLCISIRF
jgi:hypothetical protein